MTSTPRPGAFPPCPEGGVRQELIDHAMEFMHKHHSDFAALARMERDELIAQGVSPDDPRWVPPAPAPIDYHAAFKVWWHQAVHPKVQPSRAAAETHVLFAQHMVLVELGRVERGEVGR